MSPKIGISAPLGDASPVAGGSALRMRRYRQRRRSRLRSVVLDVRDGEVEWLIERGYLARNAVDDPWEVGAAIGRLLDAMLK